MSDGYGPIPEFIHQTTMAIKDIVAAIRKLDERIAKIEATKTEPERSDGDVSRARA